MSSFTRKAIRDSFLKLLEKRPLNRITVKEIVEDCGVNRNSFYYHFKDIPSLLEEVVWEEVNSFLENDPSVDSFEACTKLALEVACGNRIAMLHIYNSMSRETSERLLSNVCQRVLESYFNRFFGSFGVDESERAEIILYYKCLSFGFFLDWMNNGMRPEGVELYSKMLMQHRSRFLSVYSGSVC